MKNTILVGVTDTSASRRAVDWASERAEAHHSRVELISVIGGAVGAIGEGDVVKDAIALTQAMLDAVAVRVRERGVTVGTRLTRGNPVEELNDASRAFDLLVIGSDYRGPNSGPQRGPHGIRIVAGSHCPVAVVPDIELTDRRGVVVGVDGSPTSEHAIEYAAAEADRTGEPLTAVNAWVTIPLPRIMHSYPADYLTNMQQRGEETLAISLAGIAQKYPDLDLRRVVERGYPEVIINRLATEARLTVIGSHGRGAIGRFLLGSTSQEVVSRLVSATVVLR
ncbi:Universal stress protein family [Microbacterium esteraromaticum]|uniref:Universal stress protein family n=1 Tax=Microbacterium esteraromaticum TaxID=57043 RepID=A0A1R4JWH5_9MICO|nr:universal stress protein [Microbacterium esteraromaticum]SJN36621.1 Universal stress protein family [Microbacterium esteraromaticum]